MVAALCPGLVFAVLWISGYPFGFMAIVGTMGLIGIAINDSLVVLAALRDDVTRGAVAVEVDESRSLDVAEPIDR